MNNFYGAGSALPAGLLLSADVDNQASAGTDLASLVAPGGEAARALKSGFAAFVTQTCICQAVAKSASGQAQVSANCVTRCC
jgi:hypothetical protein